MIKMGTLCGINLKVSENFDVMPGFNFVRRGKLQNRELVENLKGLYYCYSTCINRVGINFSISKN